MQIILFQKYIHHLRVESIWNMLMASLAPIQNDWSRKFLSKYIDTCFRYIQVLVFGMSLDDDGAIVKVCFFVCCVTGPSKHRLVHPRVHFMSHLFVVVCRAMLSYIESSCLQ